MRKREGSSPSPRTINEIMMTVIKIQNRKISGISVRTKNANELDASTAKIGPLWGRFFETIAPSLSQDSIIYGVYYNYESDMNGEFNVLAGTDRLGSTPEMTMESVTIKEGDYLLFSETGEMPQAVITAWVKVWKYFSSPDCQHKRAYLTDFEVYKGPDKVEVYIGLK
ncbi:GyrI-like domain-containing protein [Bdellovibrio bacteriovorus]|uniref:GyrI-like domain-containing protein n=1 Tax=Bdellovibrio bacteriovorus TaxID=959 RepID=UPI0035A98165